MDVCRAKLLLCEKKSFLAWPSDRPELSLSLSLSLPLSLSFFLSLLFSPTPCSLSPRKPLVIHQRIKSIIVIIGIKIASLLSYRFVKYLFFVGRDYLFGLIDMFQCDVWINSAPSALMTAALFPIRAVDNAITHLSLPLWLIQTFPPAGFHFDAWK